MIIFNDIIEKKIFSNMHNKKDFNGRKILVGESPVANTLVKLSPVLIANVTLLFSGEDDIEVDFHYLIFLNEL